MEYINLQITEVGPDTGERRVVVKSPDGTEFGVFDGYKSGADGVARPATPEWMEGQTVSTALVGTVSVSFEREESGARGIEPNSEKPLEYHDHQFVGSFEQSTEKADFSPELCLYDGMEPGSDGVQRSDDKGDIAAFDIGEGHIFVNMSDTEARELDESTLYRVSVARMDLLGYVCEGALPDPQ